MAHSKRMAEAEIDSQVSPAVSWNIEQCVKWLESIGFPQYKECFIDNFIHGKRLILLDINNLIKIGIHDFDHLKIIASSIRELLLQPEPDYKRSISLPHTEPLGIFLEKKSRSGKSINNLTFSHFLKSNAKFLNHCYGRIVTPFDSTEGEEDDNL